MTETLISFETAVLAKEKGFDWLVFDAYDSYTGNDLKHASKSDNYNSNEYKSYSAPTQSLLQKWLRENHEIHIDLYPNAMGWQVNLDKTNGTHIKKVAEYNEFEETTYEQALEEGLQAALKLID